jgi:type IV pilus assembly protein PilC
MAKSFKYKLGDKLGPEAKGVLEAETEHDAIKKLTELGHTVISIRELKRGSQPFWDRPHLSFEEKLLFTKHFATMLRAGITITEALQILASQTVQAKNRQMYESIQRSVRAGQSLSESLKPYDTIFSDLFINMIETGEKSGTLDQILDYLDEQLDKEYELRKKVISAFIYPAVIMGITLLLTLGIVFFIMPKITDIFTSFDITLPLPTRFLIGFSSLLTAQPLLTLLAAILFTGFVVFLLKWKALKHSRDWIALHLPVFGKVLRYASLARFARTLTSLLQAGMPITKALNVIAKMMTNSLYQEAVQNSAAKVEQGGQLGEAFEGEEKLFPILTVKMLYVGEKTGSLETTMKQLALLYERNVDGLTRNLTVLLEPILLVFMGLMVGGVAISIILPIYQLPNLLSR